MMFARSASLLFIALTAACAASDNRVTAIDRVLADAPGRAQPSALIATELAAARAARQDGEAAALREFATPDAVLHLAAGPVAAREWTRNRTESGAGVQWAPKAVWLSCDGQAAVSYGEYAARDGERGHYVTTWQRQPNRAYRWNYMLRAPDPALVRQRPITPEMLERGAILVEATPMIRGDVADCAPAGPLSLPDTPGAGATAGSGTSSDGTLVWNWAHFADGRRSFSAMQAAGGVLTQAVRLEVGPAGEVTLLR
ncbi:hypothetical protein [Porphyrobacter sp. GA68]|uniref:hypothetical protein n=1 Tax=Porphyrobacter sp. GA68 TaxID=2883480 RepID=UPI001D18FCE7|nr:hypothetical protein [Porphyrobacter sp. GA68]